MSHPMSKVAKGSQDIIGKGATKKGKPCPETIGKASLKRPLEKAEDSLSKCLKSQVDQQVANCIAPRAPKVAAAERPIRAPRAVKTPSAHVPSSSTSHPAGAAAFFCANASAKAGDAAMTDLMLQEIIYVAAMTASEAAASAAATAVCNALCKAYRVHVELPCLQPLLPATASPLHMQSEPLDAINMPPLMPAHAKSQPSVRLDMVPPTPQTPAIGATIVTPQPPEPPSSSRCRASPQEVHRASPHAMANAQSYATALVANATAIPSSPPTEVGGEVEENRKMCDMSDKWNCKEFAIEGDDGYVQTKAAGWRQLCVQCKKHIVAQKKTSADYSQQGWPEEDELD